MGHTAKFMRVLFLVLALGAAGAASAHDEERQAVGWVEKIIIFPGNLQLKAKLDTGALNSSLNASQIEEFVRNDEKWIRFNVTNWQNVTATLEKKLIRTARIKEHDRESNRRPVIQLGICLANVFKEVEVNLVDRSNFRYQILIGRSYLQGSFVVDPARTFTVKPQCQGVSGQ